MKKLILTGIMLLMVLGVSGCRNNNDKQIRLRWDILIM